MKVAFCTCVQIGLSCIEAIHEIGGRFELLITLNDSKSIKKSGRVYLDDFAKKTNTPLIKINHINDSEVSDKLIEYDIDWLFIIGWSQIASKDLISIPNKGIIGAHPTLLPIGRGRAAIPWAILKGLNKTGVTFFKMNEGVDTGQILDQFEILIETYENATTLYEKVNKAHESLIKQIWPKIINNTIMGVDQNEDDATYWEGRTPSDGELNFNMTVHEVDRLVRATTYPYPGAYIRLQDKNEIIIWQGTLQPSECEYVLKFCDGNYYATKTELKK